MYLRTYDMGSGIDELLAASLEEKADVVGL